jgi:hypothetical protein
MLNAETFLGVDDQTWTATYQAIKFVIHIKSLGTKSCSSNFVVKLILKFLVLLITSVQL